MPSAHSGVRLSVEANDERGARGSCWACLEERALFWLAWVTILATSIAIIIKSPRPVATPLKWWQESVFYQLQADQWTEAQTEGSEGMCGRTRRNKMLKFGFNISMLKKLT